MNSWETFEGKKEECHKQLDAADAEFDAIKKIFDLKGGPSDYNMRMKTAAMFRSTIEEIFSTASGANDILQLMLPEDIKPTIKEMITELQTRMAILNKTDEKLAFIDDFNKRLNVFDQGLIDMDNWLQVIILNPLNTCLSLVNTLNTCLSLVNTLNTRLSLVRMVARGLT